VRRTGGGKKGNPLLGNGKTAEAKHGKTEKVGKSLGLEDLSHGNGDEESEEGGDLG
jgi:hypothetical protein